MGTNYYVKTEKCPTCGYKPEGIHLGKSSGGWQFSFQYNDGQYYKNVKEMKKWLKDKKIENEYGEEISPEEFWQMVKNKQKDSRLNHAQYMINEHHSVDDMVINGYSFSNHEFS